jgi:hypothetical protein
VGGIFIEKNICMVYSENTTAAGDDTFPGVTALPTISLTESPTQEKPADIQLTGVAALKSNIDPTISEQLGNNFLMVKKPRGNNLSVQLSDLYINRSIQLDITGIIESTMTSDMIVRVRGNDMFSGEPVYKEITTTEVNEDDGTTKEVVTKDFGKDLSQGITITTKEDAATNLYSTQLLIALDTVYAYNIYEDTDYYYVSLKKPSEVYDKIIVVDAESTDNTCEIARQYTEHIYTHPWAGFSEQKNFANQKATSDWILSVDADERCTPELQAEIRQVLAQSEHVGYQAPTRFITFGKPIRHGGWYPQYHIRLFRRGKAQWGRDVHEWLHVDGSVGFLRNPLMHYAHPSVHQFIEKSNRYTTIEAATQHGQGRKPSLARMIGMPVARFLYKFFYQRGFLDGCHGFVLAVLLAMDAFMTEAKLWQLYQSDENGDTSAS